MYASSSTTVTKGKQANEVLEFLRPYLKTVQKGLEEIFGKASALKYDFSDILTVAVIILLICLVSYASDLVEIKTREVENSKGKAKKD